MPKELPLSACSLNNPAFFGVKTSKNKRKRPLNSAAIILSYIFENLIHNLVVLFLTKTFTEHGENRKTRTADTRCKRRC